MQKRPNILFLMTDQMQGRVLEPGHPCRTPHLDRLAREGLRFRRAHTVNPICSPARASLMTGLLPHSHGVTTITHAIDPDRQMLREDRVHWAQQLQSAGYHTGYIGKWHVEQSEQPERFGWGTVYPDHGEAWKQRKVLLRAGATTTWAAEGRVDGPEGYGSGLLYAAAEGAHVTTGAVAVELAREWISGCMDESEPWCCFVSIQEPHDPFICSKEIYESYAAGELPQPENWSDDCVDRPGLYRKAAAVFAQLTLRQKKEAMACYYGSITEVDGHFGGLLQWLEETGQRENTIVVLTSDHGEMLGAHGLWQKNTGAFEEIYNIPLIMAGPGIETQAETDARVSLVDVGPTLLELAGADPIPQAFGRSFAEVLRGGSSSDYQRGYAEYSGTRYSLTQRVIWDGDWKLVWNGFDFDELYNLAEDPFEMRNLATHPQQQQLRSMMEYAWGIIRDTDDRALLHANYAALRLAPFGPKILDALD